jgi:hypothetical protein
MKIEKKMAKINNIEMRKAACLSRWAQNAAAAREIKWRK